MLTAPFHHVAFADFWLADQLNSLVVAILDMEYLSCFYALDFYSVQGEIKYPQQNLIFFSSYSTLFSIHWAQYISDSPTNEAVKTERCTNKCTFNLASNISVESFQSKQMDSILFSLLELYGGFGF